MTEMKNFLMIFLLLLRTWYVIVSTFFAPGQSISLSDRFYIITRLAIRRDISSILENCTFTGIIAGQNEIYLAPKHVHQLAKILCAALDILGRIERFGNAQAASSSRQPTASMP